MFTLIAGASFPVGIALLMLVLLVAAFAAAIRFSRRTPDFHSVHPGKSSTHGCKFDRVEVARTKSLVPPRLLLPSLSAADPRIIAALTGVQLSVVLDALRSLSGEASVTAGGKTGKIVSRSSFGKDIDLAMTYLEEFYRTLGLKAVRSPYKVRGKTYYNLVVELPGKVNPGKVLIVGSHLDSTAGDTGRAEPVAPGADDDASGTVALMELARALVKLPLGCTVRLVHFTGEEQGLWGSYAYSDQVAAAKTDVVAMIQMDMIGYCNKPGNRLDIHDGADRNGSHALVGAFVANVSRYGLNVAPFDTHNHAVDDRSDHAGFLDHGYKAVCLSEEFTDDGFNPNYHSTGDRISAMNLPYMVEVIKLMIATVADLADVQAS